jgi:uncharacterized membrane protein
MLLLLLSFKTKPMVIAVFWIICSFAFAAMGSEREIGFWPSFFICLLLSPVIGLIIILVSKTKATELKAEPVLAEEKGNQSTADELLKFKDLFDKGVITQEEFDTQKKRILG